MLERDPFIKRLIKCDQLAGHPDFLNLTSEIP